MCGEQPGSAPLAGASCGSSPRVRGTETPACDQTTAYRFIPACAGNRIQYAIILPASAVHPRVCGEQTQVKGITALCVGSSPRVRGTVSSRLYSHPLSRFIPACAGNSPRARSKARSATVHPRVCGEQYPTHITHSLWVGSSPRVRGTALVQFLAVTNNRFIPACAGNSISPGRHPAGSTVHPRVCGEQRKCQTRYPRLRGSSPRVRGTVTENNHDRIVRRFIPACAGNRLSAGK